MSAPAEDLPTPEVVVEEEEEEGDEAPQQISRLNSITERVSALTGKSKKLMSGIKEQAITSKTPTIATKSTLDGIMIDQRLTGKHNSFS